uniref:Uncharacterized protein AlNc14C369G11077 n=1 Tax=Albugo laibachii Nc14 TaxID=890382 RepID=F0WY31_9STRA|nr:conserved hypothetical protein [Albugo laibachii Nc14]|eukprot:CCA26380.1 conserved hypothetical protein [Albugo laibachii Nc14]
MGGVLAAVRFVVPLSTALVGGGTVTIFGISAANMVSTTTMMASDAMAVASQTSQFAVAASKEVDAKFSAENYALIRAGQSHRYQRMLPLAWKQGTCMRAVILNATAVEVITLLMRPIFSGAKLKSNRNHQMSWWLRRHPPRSSYIIAAVTQPKVSEVQPPVVDATIPAPQVKTVNTMAPMNGGFAASVPTESNATMDKNTSIAEMLSPSLRIIPIESLDSQSSIPSNSSTTAEDNTEGVSSTILSPGIVIPPPSALPPDSTSVPSVASSATSPPSRAPHESFNTMQLVASTSPYTFSKLKTANLREENLNWDFDD